jgi:hypothetical protein
MINTPNLKQILFNFVHSVYKSGQNQKEYPWVSFIQFTAKQIHNYHGINIGLLMVKFRSPSTYAW